MYLTCESYLEMVMKNNYTSSKLMIIDHIAFKINVMHYGQWGLSEESSLL